MLIIDTKKRIVCGSAKVKDIKQYGLIEASIIKEVSQCRNQN